ncbi:MAG: hypothetical protein M3R38_23765, partial [Actinomycetota bacterium]|nr:hypothetical protein [Actinomycetota bacterium]
NCGLSPGFVNAVEVLRFSPATCREAVPGTKRGRPCGEGAFVKLDSEAYELAVTSHDHEAIPAGFRRPTSALLLNFEVPSVQSEYDRLEAAGVEVLQPMQDLPAGQRHFICRAPGGVMVDVIEVVPPSEEYRDNYLS